MGMLDRLLPWRRKAAEGEPRPGPYLLQDGWLSASTGRLMNWWQTGGLNQYGESGAMVEACVSAYAQTVAMCPGSHWRTNDDGGRTRVDNSAAARVLKKPNDYETISDFLLNLVDRWYRAGEAFAYAIRDDRNEIVELHRFRYGIALIGVDGSIYYQLSGNEIAERRFDMTAPVPARDVLHVRMNTRRHPLKGESPILSVALDQALSGAALNQQVAFYLNEAKPSYVLTTDQQLTAEQTRDLRRRWNEQTQGENAGGTPILTWGLKAQQVGATAKDSMLADLLKMSDQNIALAFRMPLQVLGIGGTPFASTEALMSAWKSTGLGFALNHIEEALGLLFRLKGVPDEYIEFDTEAMLRSSFKELIDALVAGTDKVLTKNEARARLSLPRKTGGDELFMQMQDIPIGTPLEPTKPAVEPPPPDPDPDLDDEAKAIFAKAYLDAEFEEEPVPLLLTHERTP